MILNELWKTYVIYLIIVPTPSALIINAYNTLSLNSPSVVPRTIESRIPLRVSPAGDS